MSMKLLTWNELALLALILLVGGWDDASDPVRGLTRE